MKTFQEVVRDDQVLKTMIASFLIIAAGAVIGVLSDATWIVAVFALMGILMFAIIPGIPKHIDSRFLEHLFTSLYNAFVAPAFFMGVASIIVFVVQWFLNYWIYPSFTGNPEVDYSILVVSAQFHFTAYAAGVYSNLVGTGFGWMSWIGVCIAGVCLGFIAVMIQHRLKDKGHDIDVEMRVVAEVLRLWARVCALYLVYTMIAMAFVVSLIVFPPEQQVAWTVIVAIVGVPAFLGFAWATLNLHRLEVALEAAR